MVGFIFEVKILKDHVSGWDNNRLSFGWFNLGVGINFGGKKASE